MKQSGKSEVERIREKLGHFSLKRHAAEWLDMGDPELNEVLGHRDKGMLYGEIIEVSGANSTAKTALALSLAALAQKDGAGVTWLNLEGARFDYTWAKQRGLVLTEDNVIETYVGEFLIKKSADDKDKSKGKKELRLSTIEELCAEAGVMIEHVAKRHKKQVLVVDSIAAMLTEYEEYAGLEGQNNMRVGMSLPVFLGRLLRRWVGIAAHYNVLMIFTNQLRKKPTQFGDPTYTPGGEAMSFYGHARVRMRRAKGGKITDKGKMIGIKGIMSNFKNKLGGMEGAKVGFKLRFAGALEFLPVEEVERKDNE